VLCGKKMHRVVAGVCVHWHGASHAHALLAMKQDMHE
jgi:hypothetical protein